MMSSCGQMARLECGVRVRLALPPLWGLKWVHETFRDRGAFAWQAGYGAFSVSFSNLPDVKSYIARQAEHHRVRTFRDEFREFLRRHELEWDERYVWD